MKNYFKTISVFKVFLYFVLKKRLWINKYILQL